MRLSFAGAPLVLATLVACRGTTATGIESGSSTSTATDGRHATTETSAADRGAERTTMTVGTRSTTDTDSTGAIAEPTSTSDASTSRASTDTTTGGSDIGGQYVDITIAAGMNHDQGAPAQPPGCLLDVVDPPLDGVYCGPERYAGGAAVSDVDRDGHLDVLITRPYATDLLYHNNGDGTFVDVAAAIGLDDTVATAAAAFADVDGDGDVDLYVTTIGGLRHSLFIQEDGVFTEQAEARGAAIPSEYPHVGFTPAFADYDLDGDLDLYVGEWRTHALGVIRSHARLLRNLGPEQPGWFEDVTVAAGVAVDDVWQTVDGGVHGTFVLSVGWGDLDADGYPDLMLASDYACSRLFWNRGDGTFVDGTIAAGVGTDEHGMGSTAADYDRDGDLDWFVTSIVHPNKTGNRLYRNDGDRSFTDVTDDAGVRESGWGWGAVFFDLDLDGDLDLAATSGWYNQTNLDDPLVVWTNSGGVFTPAQDLLGLVDSGQGRGLVTFDADGDGDLEVLVVNNGEGVKLFRYDADDDNHWLRVQASGTISNREGIGAIVTVVTPGSVQHHEVGGTSHFLGHGPREAHFGLGEAASADVTVTWPVTGAVAVLEDVAADQVLVVSEP